MRRIHIFLEDRQLKSLKRFSGNLSENIRRSIDEYIEKRDGKKVSESLSRKGGGSND